MFQHWQRWILKSLALHLFQLVLIPINRVVYDRNHKFWFWSNTKTESQNSWWFWANTLTIWNHILKGEMPEIYNWAKLIISHSSKSIWVINLLFCQNYSPTRRSFWQKDGLITCILFGLWLIIYLAQLQILGITLLLLIVCCIFVHH